MGICVMPASSQHRYRFLQIILLVVLLGLAISLYNNWHQIIRQIIEWQKAFHGLLATHVNAIKEDPLNHGLALVALSFGYGVFHAIGPGHGKAVIITYLGSHQESLRRGAIISLMAALLQAVIAVILVVVLAKILSIRFSEVNSYADSITSASYLLVMGLGAFLFVSPLTQKWKQHLQNKNHSNEHNHSQHKNVHHHEHNCCAGQHVHQSEPKESWLQSVSVIISMGSRPCSGAIVVLIYAHLVDAFYYGILATLMMGLGTGLTIAAIALGTQLARNWFEALVNSDGNKDTPYFNAGPWLRITGGLVIFLLGFSLFQTTTAISGGHPLI